MRNIGFVKTMNTSTFRADLSENIGALLFSVDAAAYGPDSNSSTWSSYYGYYDPCDGDYDDDDDDDDDEDEDEDDEDDDSTCDVSTDPECSTDDTEDDDDEDEDDPSDEDDGSDDGDEDSCEYYDLYSTDGC